MSPEFAWYIGNGYVKKDVKSGLGIIVQRKGIEKFNSTTFTNACKYIYEAKWDAGGTDVIIREGTRWAKYDGVDSFDNLDTGRSDGVRGMCAMFANTLIMVDSGVPRKCTSSYSVANLSTDAAMPTDATAVHVHQHKVWLNSIANPMRAYYSKTDGPTAADGWSAAGDAGYLDFSQILPFGDKLLGFATFSQMFLVFIFTRHVIVYTCGTDPSAFSIQQVIPLNCISGHGVQQVGNDLAVASQEGLNSFKASLANQDLDVDDLSRYIAPLYRDLVSALADRTVVSLGFSHRLNHIYVCIPGADHTILVYSVDIQNFVGVWTGYKCYAICERVDGTMLIAGDGYVYTMNSSYADDGVKIDFQYDFPALYAKDPNSNKAFRQIEGLCRYEGNPLLTFDYSYAVDVVSGAMSPIQLQLTQNGGTLWDEGEWDASDWDINGIERLFTSNVLGRGKQMLMSISNSVLNSYIEIPYLLLRYKRENIKVR
jgi:hypothetical protein